MTEQPGLVTSIAAAAEITGKRFIDYDGNHANDEAALGVSVFSVASGEQVPVAASGIVLVEVGTGGVTKGGLVKADANGKAIALGSAGQPCGRAVETKSAAAFALINLYDKTPVVVAP